MTAGKRERVTAKTRNTDTACTQICLKMVRYGGDTSKIFTFTEALTANEREGRGTEGKVWREKGRGERGRETKIKGTEMAATDMS